MVKLETLRNLDLLIVNVREHPTKIGAYRRKAKPALMAAWSNSPDLNWEARLRASFSLGGDFRLWHWTDLNV
jgi:hypothetical protein